MGQIRIHLHLPKAYPGVGNNIELYPSFGPFPATDGAQGEVKAGVPFLFPWETWAWLSSQIRGLSGWGKSNPVMVFVNSAKPSDPLIA